jgi:hypothetical protein
MVSQSAVILQLCKFFSPSIQHKRKGEGEEEEEKKRG